MPAWIFSKSNPPPFTHLCSSIIAAMNLNQHLLGPFFTASARLPLPIQRIKTDGPFLSGSTIRRITLWIVDSIVSSDGIPSSKTRSRKTIRMPSGGISGGCFCSGVRKYCQMPFFFYERTERGQSLIFLSSMITIRPPSNMVTSRLPSGTRIPLLHRGRTLWEPHSLPAPGRTGYRRVQP